MKIVCAFCVCVSEDFAVDALSVQFFAILNARKNRVGLTLQLQRNKAECRGRCARAPPLSLLTYVKNILCALSIQLKKQTGLI